MSLLLLNKLNDLTIFFLILLIIELGILILMSVKRKIFKKKNIKKVHLFLTMLVLSLLAGLIFKIDWNFTGENKDLIIIGKSFISLLLFTNLLSIIMIILFAVVERLFKKVAA
jgi:hypothetical protein